MYRFATTKIRLDAWRKWSADMRERYAKRGVPHPAEYEPGKLPPKWFGRLSSATVNRAPTDHNGKPRTPTYNYGDGLGTDRDPDRPFRFVGFADEVVRIRHSSWYGDDDGYNLFRGVVFQIPAIDGNTRFLAGVEWGEYCQSGFDSGGGWIEIGRGDVYESIEDAARAADSMAQYAGEEAREEDARQREEEEEAERLAEEEEERQRAEELAGHVANVNPCLIGSGYQVAAKGSDIYLTNEEGEPL